MRAIKMTRRLVDRSARIRMYNVYIHYTAKKNQICLGTIINTVAVAICLKSPLLNDIPYIHRI